MPYPRHLLSALARSVFGAAVSAVAAAALAEPSCSVKSSDATPVVELYTSEGCSSCPPADRWASRLAPSAKPVVLAFHVDYWDRLGWKDRFASPLHTRRQAEQRSVNGTRFSYTPQVVVDGIDRKDWQTIDFRATSTPRTHVPVAVELARDGSSVRATVSAAQGAPTRLAAYWAVTEQNHVTAVKAGENQGETLHHDHVVREYQPVAAWLVDVGRPTTLLFQPTSSAEPGHPREINLVVVDARTGRPVQAAKLGC